MAHGMKWWLGSTLLACVLIAVGYLPPRGAIGLDVVGFSRWRGRVESEATARRNELAERYRVLNGELEAASVKDKADPLLAAERAAGRPPKALVLGNDAVSQQKRQYLQTALDSAWRQLDLGNTKIAVVLVSPLRERQVDRPDAFSFLRTYLLPDNSNRTTCVVVFPWDGLHPERPPTQELVTQRVRFGLGPCAYYARFGAPSPRVRHWLDANNYDVTESSDWSGIRRGRDLDNMWEISDYRGYGTFVFYSYVYEMDFTKVACMAGRTDACVQALRRGDGSSQKDYRRIVSPAVGWRISDSRLPDESSTLAAVIREAGDDAFQQFWTTSLPIDSALTVALGKPVGEWLAQRPQSKALELKLGPLPPLATTIQAILAAVGLLVVGAVLVQRRQVK